MVTTDFSFLSFLPAGEREEFEARLAARPTNEAGEPLCKCGATYPADRFAFQCNACAERELAASRAKADLAQRLRGIAGNFHRYSGWDDASATSKLPRWSFARLDNPAFRKRVSKRLLTAVERYQGDKNLVISAATGSGKTALVTAWLYRELDRANAATTADKAFIRGFAFVTGPDLAQARKQLRLGAGEAPMITAACDASLLVLDELGFEAQTEAVFDVIDDRYRQGKPTMVTTGLRSAEFRARYGDALFRRLAEGGAVVEDWGAGG